MESDAKSRCAQCGYELMGSQARGHCPECGGRFDKSTGMGVVQRSAALEAARRGDRAMMWFKVWTLAGLAAACIGFALWRASVGRNPTGALVVGAMFAGVLAFGAFVTWYTEGREQ